MMIFGIWHLRRRPLELALISAGALLFIAAGELAAQESGRQTGRPYFSDGQAQEVEEFKEGWIQHDLWVEASFDSDGDGKPDRLHVSVTRPKQTDEGLKVPVIYQSSPYYSGTGSNDPKYMWNPKQRLGGIPPERPAMPSIEQQSNRPVLSKDHLNEWVPRGFAVVHSASPGTGLSQGCPTIGGQTESLAPKAVIDWLCGRASGFTEVDSDQKVVASWSTGKVGMIGTSYNGTLALAAATTGVEGLEAIVPIAPNTSYYHYYRSHGLVRHPGGYMGEDIDVLYDFVHSGPVQRREYCDCEVRNKTLIANLDRSSGNYNSFWKGRDYIHQLQPMRAAMLMAHAFNDWNVMPEHGIRIYQAAKEKGLPVQLYMHQGGHGGAPPLSQVNRWFTRYLYGIENGVEKDSPVWIVREGAPRDKPAAYEAYPHVSAQPLTLVVRGDGLAGGSLEMAGSKSVESHLEGNSLQEIVDNYSFSAVQLCKAEWSNHRLLFATPKLSQPLHLSGTAKIKLRLASDRSAVNLSVWLVALPWTDSGTITDDIVTRGWADPQNASSIEVDHPLQLGRFRDIEFDLQPDDQIIPAGEQLGLMIFSSDRDFTLWPEPGSRLSVDLSSSSLTLPVVGGGDAWREAGLGVPR
jgi:X-Pro dipeptidyl-peptidase